MEIQKYGDTEIWERWKIQMIWSEKDGNTDKIEIWGIQKYEKDEKDGNTAKIEISS